MKVVVTGGCGRLGSAIVRHLAAQGCEVVAVDRKWVRDLPATVRVLDLTVREPIYDALQGADAVVHLANHPHLGATDNQSLFAENCAMNINVFQAAVELGIKKMIYASSIQAVIGDRPRERAAPSGHSYLPLDQCMPARPGNLYAASKVAGEVLLRAHHQAGEFTTAVAIRFPWLAPEEWFAWAYHGRARHREAEGDGDEVKSFLLHGEAAKLVWRILSSGFDQFRTYLPAQREAMSILSIPQIIEKYYAGVPLRRPAAEIETLIDMRQIEAEVGWYPDPITPPPEPVGVRPWGW